MVSKLLPEASLEARHLYIPIILQAAVETERSARGVERSGNPGRSIGARIVWLAVCGQNWQDDKEDSGACEAPPLFAVLY